MVSVGASTPNHLGFATRRLRRFQFQPTLRHHLTGYSDRLSVQPGETINFKVSCIAGSTFEARLVRIRCGDPNPGGPGVREEALAADFQGTYPARFQRVNLGSYARIADADVVASAQKEQQKNGIGRWRFTP